MRRRCAPFCLVLWAALLAAACGDGGPEETDASEDTVPADAEVSEDMPANADAADEAGSEADEDTDGYAVDVEPDAVAP